MGSLHIHKFISLLTLFISYILKPIIDLSIGGFAHKTTKFFTYFADRNPSKELVQHLSHAFT